jgi:hypothetical protein
MPLADGRRRVALQFEQGGDRHPVRLDMEWRGGP